jgi:hypothetical protein
LALQNGRSNTVPGTVERLLERWNETGREKEKARTVMVRAVAHD